MAEKNDIPWDEIDKNMIDLVRELNSFEGVKTFSCCGGHSSPGSGQWPKGHFYLSFKVNQTKAGWLALEFLTWFINGQNGLNSYYKNKSESKIRLEIHSLPPYNVGPGEALEFKIVGNNGVTPEQLAVDLRQERSKFVTPEEYARRWETHDKWPPG